MDERMKSFPVEDDRRSLAMEVEDSMAFSWHMTGDRSSLAYDWGDTMKNSKTANSRLRKFQNRAPSRTHHVCYVFTLVASIIFTIAAIVVGIILLMRFFSHRTTPCKCLITFESVGKNWTETLCVEGDSLDRKNIKENVTLKHTNPDTRLGLDIRLHQGIETFSFKGCGSLLTLDLFGLPDFKSFPDNLHQMAKLQHIDLGWANIRTLPESIGDLRDLRTLDLHDAPVVSLPHSLTECINLQVLDLRRTQIKKLPKDLERWKLLKELHLGYSNILVLPNNIGELTNLRKLTWMPRNTPSGDKYPEFVFPESFQKLQLLEELRLEDDWRIKWLPKYITQFRNLKILSVSGCRFFVDLPEKIANLSGLVELDMSDTRHLRLPFSFEKLINLETLKLEGCNFPGDYLGRAICVLCTKHRLRYLSVSANKVESLKMCKEPEKIKVCAAIARMQSKSAHPIGPCVNVPADKSDLE